MSRHAVEPQALLLRPDNFTLPRRTPWGGTRIARRYKPALDLPSDLRIGESWEVSVEPSFPSRLHDGDGLLEDCIAADPAAWLGADLAERHTGRLPLLVKLLDADQDLSVQVHPSNDAAILAADESGKPEAWVILDAVPGAGIYLGWRDGVGRPEVEACIDAEGGLDQLLNFIEVSPGQSFVVPARTPHAIGAGVTLLEPQQVLPGKRGVTYRFWDWNRRYDDEGRLDSGGRPRTLHLAEALSTCDWDAPRGAALVEQALAQPRPVAKGSGDLQRLELLCCPQFATEAWLGSGSLERSVDRFLALTCTAGEVEIEQRGRAKLRVPAGYSAVLPACMGGIGLDARDAQVFVTWSRG